VSLAELTRHGISFVADNLLHLRIMEQGSETKRYLRVVKMRGCSHTTTLRELLISEYGLTMGEAPVI
jgi:circadian clock protein KaiC